MKPKITDLALLCAAMLLGSAGISPGANLADQIQAKAVFPTTIEWVGTNEPPLSESQALLGALKTFDTAGPVAGFTALHKFLEEYPNSPWCASLHASIAEYDRGLGRYTLALEHWHMAWELTHEGTDARSQRVAARTVAHWTRLLASLGRKDEIKKLFAEMDHRRLPLGPYGVIVDGTRGGLAMMNAKPGESYRCGSFALGHMALALGVSPETANRLFQTPSPDTGFAMSQLVTLAESNGIPVKAVRRPSGAEIIVPCVVHWRLDHYAAIVQHKDNRYEVVDPTFEHRVWMSADAIDEEAAGEFLVPANKAPLSWKALGPRELAEVYGKGGPDDINYWNDDAPPGCGSGDSQDANCDPPSANDGSGGQPPPCCAGMPEWRISEPYEAMWLIDTPSRYHLSNGQWTGLHLTYKHEGEIRPANTPGFGDKWSCNWLGLLQYSVTNQPDYFVDYLAGGGLQYFATNGAIDYKTARSLVIVSNSVPELITPTGSRNVYGFSFGYSSGGTTNYFLTQQVDRYGRAIVFNYTNSAGTVRLLSITDIDGRTTTLGYANASFPGLITSVTNPYQQTVTLTYDNLGLLTNIVDAAGLTNAFRYDGNDNITNLITPYGATTFAYLASTNTSNGMRARGVLVTEPTLDHQLFTYTDNNTNASGQMPCALDGHPDYRLSYHWNRSQYLMLSAQGKSTPLNMPDQDYQLAEIKHWLHDFYDPSLTNLFVSDTLESSAGPLDPNTGQRPSCLAYTYQGQSGPFINYTTNGGLQRVTSVYADGSPAINFTRSSLGRPLITSYTTSTEGLANYTNIYDPGGRCLLQEWGPRGELVRGYGYHPVITNLLTSVTNAVGDVIRYFYDTNTLKVTNIVFPSGLSRTNIYYASGPSKGFLAVQIDAGIRTNSFGWVNGNLAIQTNELGLITSNYYDNLNRLTGTAYPDGTTTSNLYQNLDIVATKDRLNHWAYFGFNSLRQLVAVTNVHGQVTQYQYCQCGSPSVITRWNGSTPVTDNFIYDTSGRLTNAIYADGYSVTNLYDLDNDLAKIIDSGGRELDLTYYRDGLRWQLQQANLGGLQFLYRQFDEYGRVTLSTDRNGVTFTNGYDFIDRLTARWLQSYSPVPGVETFVYTAAGLTNYTDPLTNLTIFVRDPAGRLLFETNANHELLQFVYNPADELTTLTDGKGQTTTWKYDQYGRVTNKVDALGTNAFFYAYDPNDRLTNRTSAAKGTTVYAYDPIGNLTNILYPVSATIKFQYDGLNRLTNMIDGLGATAFTWTPGDQLASETGPWADDTVSYTYANRLRAGMSLIQPNSSPWVQTYVYDNLGRLTNTTSPAGPFTYQYAGSGASDRIGTIILPTGANDYRAYDDAGRVSQMQFYVPGGATFEQFLYSYDAGSQRSSETWSVPGYSKDRSYGYDKIGQLVSATASENSGTVPRLNEQFGYAYDKAWNLNYRTNGYLIETFNANAANELTSISRSGTLTVAGTVGGPNPGYGGFSVTVSGNGVPSPGTAATYGDFTWAITNVSPANGQNTYTASATDGYGRTSQDSVTVNLPISSSLTYDANGNLLGDGNRNFAYDDENQLTSVWVTNAWRSDFVYDGLMRRRIRREYTWSSGAWLQTNEVHYVYDARLVVQERNANNTPLLAHTWGLDLSSDLQAAGGIGGLLARTDAGLLAFGSPQAHAYYHADANGNITCLISISNAVVARYAYDPYGNVLSKAGGLANANLYRFSSKEWHENSGVLYYGFRGYDPRLQRWVNRDPLGDVGSLPLLAASIEPWAGSGEAGDATRDELLDVWSHVNGNLFAGVGNDPINNTDPFGLCDGLPAGSDPFNLPQTLKLAEELAEEAGEVPNAAERAAAQAARGAKSYEQWLKHEKNLKAAQERLAKLKQLLEKTKGPKAQQPVKEAIKNLEKDIKGHVKEMSQKWPKGCPAH